MDRRFGVELASLVGGEQYVTTARMVRSAVAGLIALLLALMAVVAPAAQASPASPRAGLGAVSYKFTLSKIAFTGSHIVIAATDSHGDLYFFWKRQGTSTWHKQLVARGGHGKSVSKPSIAWTGHALLIVALDKAGDLVSYTQHSGKSAWKYQRVAKAHGGHFKAPSLSVAGNGAVLIGTGTAARLLSFARAPGGSSWPGSPWRPARSARLRSSPLLTVTSRRTSG